MKTAHIQAVATETRHPRLVRWWNDGQGDKSAKVRIALEWFLEIEEQIPDIKDGLDRNEALLLEIKAYLEGER